MKYAEFLRVASLLNRELGVTPLLFGSLGLERRLHMDLNADDIDVLIPERLSPSRRGGARVRQGRLQRRLRGHRGS